jgi:hypothetical protein
MNILRVTYLFLILIPQAFTSSMVQADESLSVPYPEGYRQWAHVKSQIATEAHPRYKSIGGIHHIYANEIALRGYQSGTFPNGSIIVFDLLSLTSKDGSLIEGD